MSCPTIAPSSLACGRCPSATLVEAVRAAVAGAAPADAIRVSVLHDNPPMLVPADASIHEVLCGLVGQTDSIGVSFASDAGFLREGLGLETVLFGPGSIEVAHRPNEFLPVDEFRRAGEIVDTLIGRLCGARIEA
jgi:acetylornithine deacetylase